MDQPLILSPGERVVLDAPASRKIRAGDKSLVLIEAKGLKLSILARKKGQTLLVIGNNRYKLFILEDSLKLQALHLERLLSGLKGLEWSLSPSWKFQIFGELYRFSDWLELKKAFKKYPFEYEFKARMEGELKNISSYYFKQKLKKPLEVLWGGLPFVSVPEGSYLPAYQSRLKAFGLQAQERKGWFFKAPFVQIDLAVVESLSSSSFFSGGNLDKSLSGFSSMLSFLSFLKNSGKGKSLHHSSVLAQSGKSLELESGGQMPFSSFQVKTERETVNWKSHGLKLTLKAHVGEKNQLRLQLKLRLSEPLAFSAGSSSAPALKNQTLQTEMILNEGRIFKLFEMKKKSKSRNLQGRLAFLLKDLNFLSGGQNTYSMSQFIFIQIKILESQQGLKIKKRGLK